MGLLFKNLGALKSAIKVEHDIVMDRLRMEGRASGYKFHRVREPRIIAPAPRGGDKKGYSRFYDGQWFWDGTKRDLEKAILAAVEDGYMELTIEQGYDSAQYIGQWYDGGYEPDVDQFEIKLWQKDATDVDGKVEWGMFSTALP